MNHALSAQDGFPAEWDRCLVRDQGSVIMNCPSLHLLASLVCLETEDRCASHDNKFSTLGEMRQVFTPGFWDMNRKHRIHVWFYDPATDNR